MVINAFMAPFQSGSAFSGVIINNPFVEAKTQINLLLIEYKKITRSYRIRISPINFRKR